MPPSSSMHQFTRPPAACCFKSTTAVVPRLSWAANIRTAAFAGKAAVNRATEAVDRVTAPSAPRLSQQVMTKTPPATAAGAVYPAHYEEQLQEKIGKLKDLFAGHRLPAEIEVHRSSPTHFRMRAEFRIWHEGQDLCYVMFEQPGSEDPSAAGDAAAVDAVQPADAAAAASIPAQQPVGEAAQAAAGPGEPLQPQQGQQQQHANMQQEQGNSNGAAAAADGVDASAAAPAKQKGKGKGNWKIKVKAKGSGRKQVSRVRIDEFPVATQLICSLMPLVRSELVTSPALREKLFQVNFHSSLTNQALITMNYHKQLDDVWQAAAQAMRAKLLKALGPEQCAALHVIGRSHKQKVMVDAEHVIERMEVAGRTYEYMQIAGCFSQPNGGMCQQMLNWAVDVTRGSTGDLLELYCGSGTFTLPLAQNFKQVVATEISKASVMAARHNMEANGVDNIFLARMSSEEFVETWRVKGSRHRLAGLDWDKLSLNTLLVDPPRAGLDPDTEALLREFDQVVYISCNPETLANNLRAVADTHTSERFAVFDQFPYTHHLECGAFLRRTEAI